MNARDWNYAGLATVFLTAGLAVAHPDELPRLSGAPNIFSTPKPATVSSNLNQLDSKTSPFIGLESDLKRPFQIFDAGRENGSFRPPAGLTDPPAAPAHNRRVKELMDKRAEMMLLEPENEEAKLGGGDPLQAPEDTPGATGKKHKTPLDRYYDQLDHERAAAFTNQVHDSDLFGNNQDREGKEPPNRPRGERRSEEDRKTSDRLSGRIPNNVFERGGLFAETINSKSSDDQSDLKHLDAAAERSLGRKEARLEEYKRLLGGPGYSSRSGEVSSGLPVAGTTTRPAAASALPAWSSTPPASNPRDSFTSRAGLVGAPPTLPSLSGVANTAPNLNSAPSPWLQPKPPTSTFSIPKRQF